MRILFTAMLMAVLPFAAQAQHGTVAAVRASDNPSRSDRLVLESALVAGTRPRGRDIPLRALAGAGGAFAGAFAGAYVGASVPHRPCGCDDPGLSEVLTGAMVGTFLGAAIAAGAPHLHSECSAGRRIGLGLLGGLGGAVIGAVAGSNISSSPVPVLLFIGGAGVGSGLASSLC